MTSTRKGVLVAFPIPANAFVRSLLLTTFSGRGLSGKRWRDPVLSNGDYERL